MITKTDFDSLYSSFFNGLTFEEATHTYRVTHQRSPLPSVSGLIKKFEPYVDFQSKLIEKARRLYISPAELQAIWNEKRDLSCAVGTETHLFAENFTGVEIPDTGLKQSAANFLLELPTYYKVVKREAQMYHKVYGFSGTSDLVLQDLRDGSFVIADYKTNEDLEKHYNTYLKPPFSHLVSNNLHKYYLQLNFYTLLLEQLNVKVSARYIVWLLPTGKYQVFAVPRLVETLIEWLNKNTVNENYQALY